MKAVSLFIPCIVDQWLPSIGMAAADLLRRIGCRPYFRRQQTCCGQVLYNSGHTNAARKLARRFIVIFEADELIVSPSASCVHMVKSHYPVLFADDPFWRRRAESLGARVFELSEFMVDHMGATDVGARFEGFVAFHESCSHLRGLGLSDQPKALLDGVSGLTRVSMEGPDICCGFGGRFSVDYPEISTAMAADKAERFAVSGADVLILGEPGCLLQIGGYVNRHYPGRRVVHLAAFLAENAEGFRRSPGRKEGVG